jgi:hypothetical protein
MDKYIQKTGKIVVDSKISTRLSSGYAGIVIRYHQMAEKLTLRLSGMTDRE